MKNLYNTILSRIAGQVPEIKMVDFDMGQLELLANDVRPGLIFPCCLVDLEYPDCEDAFDGQQLITARITFKLAFEVQHPSDSLTQEARRNSALSIFDAVNKLHVAFQGFSTDEFSAFSRLSLAPDRRFTGIKVFDAVYSTTFVE